MHLTRKLFGDRLLPAVLASYAGHSTIPYLETMSDNTCPWDSAETDAWDLPRITHHTALRQAALANLQAAAVRRIYTTCLSLNVQMCPRLTAGGSTQPSTDSWTLSAADSRGITQAAAAINRVVSARGGYRGQIQTEMSLVRSIGFTAAPYTHFSYSYNNTRPPTAQVPVFTARHHRKRTLFGYTSLLMLPGPVGAGLTPETWAQTCVQAARILTSALNTYPGSRLALCRSVVACDDAENGVLAHLRSQVPAIIRDTYADADWLTDIVLDHYTKPFVIRCRGASASVIGSDNTMRALASSPESDALGLLDDPYFTWLATLKDHDYQIALMTGEALLPEFFRAIPALDFSSREAWQPTALYLPPDIMLHTPETRSRAPVEEPETEDEDVGEDPDNQAITVDVPNDTAAVAAFFELQLPRTIDIDDD